MVYIDVHPTYSGPMESFQVAPFCLIYGQDETTKTHPFLGLDTSGQPGHSKEAANGLEILQIQVSVYLCQL